MLPSYHKIQRVLMLMACCPILFVLSACTMVGPRAIGMGRADYNEVINRTEDEQMLLSIVKGRYGDTFSLLSVSNVAANVRFTTTADIEAGIGPSKYYLGNLVPFSGGLAYEENPTITYAPVEGELYLQNLLAPIPFNILVLFIRTGSFSEMSFILLAKRINNLRNPDFLDTPSAEPDARFRRFVELNSELRKAGVLQWVENPGKEASFNILISGYAPTYSRKVHEYFSLLELPFSDGESKDIIFPVYFGVKSGNLDGIAITTRSTFDLTEILRAAIEVPQEHASKGLTKKFPPQGLPGKNICIHASKDKPQNAAIAVKHRGYWFYIEDTDLRTKMFYYAVRTLWSVSIVAAADQKAAPVLTIPVSN